MGALAMQRVSWTEYLEAAERSDEKLEYDDGVIVAMSGGSLRHAMVGAALQGEFRAQLRGKPCVPMSSDARVRVPHLQFSAYPDLSVVCGPLQTDPNDPHGLLNPTLVAEVLSPSTERWDRGVKFRRYQRIPSLRHILLVDPDEVLIEHYARLDRGWRLITLGPGDELVLEDLGVTIALDGIYEGLPPIAA